MKIYIVFDRDLDSHVVVDECFDSLVLAKDYLQKRDGIPDAKIEYKAAEYIKEYDLKESTLN